MGSLSQLAVRMPPWKLIHHSIRVARRRTELNVDPRERVSRPADVPLELRDLLYLELESAEQREISAEEEAKVEARLADLGYL